jgi:uncharacterized protein
MPARLADAVDSSAASRRDAGRTRLCIATREPRLSCEMIRFVAGPNMEAVPDIALKLPGRGVWITARRALVAQAVRRGALARGLKCNVNVPPDFADALDPLLERWVLDALGMARKARLAVIGFGNVANALAGPRTAGDLVALFCARETGADATARLASARRGEGQRNVETIEAFTGAQLDLAFGRLNVVHAALLAGRASGIFLARWRILKSFRADDPDH